MLQHKPLTWFLIIAFAIPGRSFNPASLAGPGACHSTNDIHRPMGIGHVGAGNCGHHCHAGD